MGSVLSSIEVLKKKENKGNQGIVDVGDVIEVKAHIVDNKSGVKSTYIGIRTPSGLRTVFIHLHLDTKENFWTGSYMVQATDEGGLYEDFFIHLEDNAGNTINSWELLGSFKEKLKFTINNPCGDAQAPKIINIEVVPRELKVGDTITVGASFSDDNSGVKSAYIGIKTPSGSRTLIVHLNMNAASNLWTGNYKILPTDEGGLYEELFIHLEDNAGNSINSWELLSLYKEKTEFKVINSNGDIQAPTLNNIEIIPKLVNVNDTLTIKANISDDNSGVKSAYVGIKSPLGSKILFVYLNKEIESNLWIGSYKMLQTDQGGIYKDMFIHLEDNAGNPINSWDLLNAFKNNMTFTVNNDYSGDIEPPEIKHISMKTDN